MRSLGLWCFFIFFTSFQYANAQSGKMKAYIDYKSYYSPEHGPYVDVQFQFLAYSTKFQAVEGGLQAKVAVSTVITNNITTDTASVHNYVLESPLMRDSIIEDFFDILRISLQPGKYTAHIEIIDLIANGTPITGKLDLTVTNYSQAISMSDILIAEAATTSPATESPFFKSGYEIIPRISNFFGQEVSNLPYYVELYNTTQIADSSFGLRQQIISTSTNSAVPGFSRVIRFKQDDVVPILRNLDISKLYSGSYALKLDLIDRTGNELCQAGEFFFERINENEGEFDIDRIVLNPNFQGSITDDSVKYYLESLIPIARPAETKSIISTLKTGTIEMCRKHIQHFWTKTAGANAYDEWIKYKAAVELVEKNYGNNFQQGYETDRGRVYLQYGQPNTIIVKDMNPSEYPYEIWHYYKIKNFSNKRFVFYNPDLTNNAHRLLHSDMIGELQNHKWQQMLSKRNGGAFDVDSQQGTDHYGGNSQYYYKQD